MPGKPRFDLPGVPAHVIQRGNNRQAVFFSEDDYGAYRQPFRGALEESRIHGIRATVQTGTTLGGERFRNEVEIIHKCGVGHARRGRLCRNSGKKGY
jgi:hypothetical protein